LAPVEAPPNADYALDQVYVLPPKSDDLSDAKPSVGEEAKQETWLAVGRGLEQLGELILAQRLWLVILWSPLRQS
jgi:hypothetical protein